MWDGLRAVLRLSVQRDRLHAAGSCVLGCRAGSEDARLEIPQQRVFPGLSSSAVLVGNHLASAMVSVSLLAAERTVGTAGKDVKERLGSWV